MRKTSLPERAVVYRVVNLQNGKFYIGVTTKSLRLRLSQHFAAAKSTRGNGHFYRAIRKWGRDSFVIEEVAKCVNAEEALMEERRFIALLRPQYNSTLGGEGQLGRTFTDEAKKRIGDAHRGKPGPMLGKTHSPETVKKLKFNASSDESRERWAEFSSLGPKASSKQVICLDDGREFGSASSAARFYGIAKSAVIEVCHRHPRRAQAGGKVFRYVGDVFDAATELATAKKRTGARGKANVVEAT